MADLALLLGILSLFGTVVASVRVRRPVALGFPIQITSWLVGELPLVHLAAQLVAAAVLWRLGACEGVTGWLGLAALTLSAVGLVAVHRRAIGVPAALEHDLRAGMGEDYLDRIAPALRATLGPVRRGRLRWPFAFDVSDLEVRRNVPYGEHGRHNLLDVYRSRDAGRALPILVYIHGGAWTIGNKDQQGKPLLAHLARNGYVTVSINHRLGPKWRWPAPIVDVKRALAWVRANATELGGDPRFIAVAGSSSGGHLAALAALSAGDEAFQPGFEGADASVQACIPIYAPFDLTDHFGIRRRAAMRRFLERAVMATRLADDRNGWERASPLLRVGPHAPPFYVIAAGIDVLVWREETERAVAALRLASLDPVVYSDVAGAQHAFEVFHSIRADAVVEAIARFLAALRSRPERDGPK